MKTLTIRQAFKLQYSLARQMLSNGVLDYDGDNIAYHVTDSVIDHLVQVMGYDYESLGKTSKAVLWAIHWRFCKPLHTDIPQGMSERHFCFESADYVNGVQSRTWFQHPGWP